MVRWWLTLLMKSHHGDQKAPARTKNRRSHSSFRYSSGYRLRIALGRNCQRSHGDPAQFASARNSTFGVEFSHESRALHLAAG